MGGEWVPSWVRVKWAMRRTVSSCFSVSEQALSMFKERRQRMDSELEELQDRTADGVGRLGTQSPGVELAAD